MQFCLGILLYLLVELTAFQTEDLESTSYNSLITNADGYSAVELNQVISKPHLITKRHAHASSSRRSNRRKSKDRKRRRKRKNKTKETSFGVHQGSQDKGILNAVAISAGRINAKSMKADSIVADVIYADTIHGDTIIVTAKQENPDLSEFIYDRNGQYDTKQTMVHHERYNPQSYTTEDYVNSNDHSILPDMNKRGTYIRPSTTRTKNQSDNLISKGSRSSYRTSRGLWNSNFPETTVIDTANHPFISFQNGYVKRQRIIKPRSRKSKQKSSNTRRYQKRRSKTHSNFWKERF